MYVSLPVPDLGARVTVHVDARAGPAAASASKAMATAASGGPKGTRVLRRGREITLRLSAHWARLCTLKTPQTGPAERHAPAWLGLSATGRVMAVTTDPLSLIPAFGGADSARLAGHLLASDLWTSGIPPAYASVCFSLPPGYPESEFATYWAAMSEEFERLGIAVVAGHTGRYAGCDLSILGAATLIGVGDEGRTVG